MTKKCLTDPRAACSIRTLCTVYIVGATNGAIVGGATAIGIATANGRTVYTGSIVPYKERSSGLKYGGAALLVGGALLMALWPNQPAVMRDVSIARTPGGVAVGKRIGW